MFMCAMVAWFVRQRVTSMTAPSRSYLPEGLVQPARVYSSERLQYPMRRVGERGSGEFERITWDEAIAEIAEKWKSYREEFGPTSIAFFLGSGNTGTLGGGAPEGSVMARLLNVMGASRVLPDRDIATPMAWAYMFGAGPTAIAHQTPSTPNTMCLGCDTACPRSSSLTSSSKPVTPALNLLLSTSLIAPLASKSDWFIPVHPATDGALALGAIREIFEQGWEATDFLRDHTEAPLLIKEDGMFLRMSDLGRGAN